MSLDWVYETPPVKALSVKDLPDVYVWRMPAFLSLERAALLWGGINPTFTTLQEAKDREHPQKYNWAYVTLQALLAATVLKTLRIYNLVLFHEGYGTVLVNQQNTDFTVNDICASETMVLRDVLIEWARREPCPTLRQYLEQQQTAPLNTTPLIEYQPYQPTHENPALVIAMQLSSEIWDKQQAGVRPPKQLETQEFIRKRYRELTGVEPLQAEIDRIDRIARPPRFKNQ